MNPEEEKQADKSIGNALLTIHDGQESLVRMIEVMFRDACFGKVSCFKWYIEYHDGGHARGSIGRKREEKP